MVSEYRNIEKKSMHQAVCLLVVVEWVSGGEVGAHSQVFLAAFADDARLTVKTFLEREEGG